jgi:hypothetical protein
MLAWKQFFRGGAFCIGLGLLALNVSGLSSSLRNPAIFQETNCYFPNDIRLSESELRARLEAPIQDRRKFVVDVTHAINDGIAHYWNDEGIDTYHLRVPPTENYLLFAASYLLPRRFAKYEFYDADRAIERGVGLCSQHSIIEQEILRRRGFNSRIVGLNGHVLLEADVAEAGQPSEWWLLDPDYGVVLPHSLHAVEQQPGLAASGYLEAGHDKQEVAHVTNLFASPDNVTVERVSGRVLQEQISYVLIWFIPGALIVLAAGSRFPSLLHRRNGGGDRSRHRCTENNIAGELSGSADRLAA